jgi:hypothetical protein
VDHKNNFIEGIVVGIHRGIVIFSFFYDVMRISVTMMSFVNDTCIHGSLVLTFGA